MTAFATSTFLTGSDLLNPPSLRLLSPLSPARLFALHSNGPTNRNGTNSRRNGAPRPSHYNNGPTSNPIPNPLPNNDNFISTENYSEHQDEIFFQGLSYPADVLEWCSTNPPSWNITNKLSQLRPSSEDPRATATPFSAQGMSTRICSGDHDFYTPRVEPAFVDTFRMSSPYINAHQGLVFVVHIPGALLEEELFASVMEDIALMSVVGIKLILVLGPEAQVNRRLAQENIKSKFVDGIRVTNQRALQIVKEVAGSMRFEVEAQLSRGVINMPSAGRVSIVSGSFYSAQPVGVIDGEDFGYTGKVRRIDAEALSMRLDQGDIIVIPNVGSSPSGQHFNCMSEEVAAECAGQLGAEKLIFMGNGETLYDKRSDHTIPNLTLKSAARFLRIKQNELPRHFRNAMTCSVQALQKGVRRAHILNRFLNGVLLMEVFHRDGVGLMVSRDLYEGFRKARLTDLNGLEEIIKPLEEQGILKERSRTTLERDIGQFVVIERDGMIIACMSLSQIENEPTWAELGCLAVHRDYRKLGKGDAMLGFTERMAYDMGVRNLIILSTQSFDWFKERGFSEVSVDDMPKSRQAQYDKTRNSKIFHKLLLGSRAVRYIIPSNFFGYRL